MSLPTSGVAAETAPDVFKGVAQLRLDPFPFLTGTAYSSHAPASTYFHQVVLGVPVQVNGINVVKSLNAVVAAATSANSSGSNGYSYVHQVTVFKRQDYGANSSNLTTVTSGSFGLTGSFSHSSGSQTFGLIWQTDATGGASTLSTTSGDGNWSSYATGPKVVRIPVAWYLSAGEYFVAHGQSSSTASSNSNLTLLSISNLHIAPQVVTVGALGLTVTAASLAPYGLGHGAASAVTTSTTMAGSVITCSAAQFWVHNYSGI